MNRIISNNYQENQPQSTINTKFETAELSEVVKLDQTELEEPETAIPELGDAPIQGQEPEPVSYTHLQEEWTLEDYLNAGLEDSEKKEVLKAAVQPQLKPGQMLHGRMTTQMPNIVPSEKVEEVETPEPKKSDKELLNDLSALSKIKTQEALAPLKGLEKTHNEDIEKQCMEYLMTAAIQRDGTIAEFVGSMMGTYFLYDLDDKKWFHRKDWKSSFSRDKDGNKVLQKIRGFKHLFELKAEQIEADELRAEELAKETQKTEVQKPTVELLVKAPEAKARGKKDKERNPLPSILRKQATQLDDIDVQKKVKKSLEVHIDNLHINSKEWEGDGIGELSFQNGVLDLATGTLREYRKESKTRDPIGYDFDPQADCPLWEKTLTETLDDPEVIRYLQKVMGYAAAGDPIENKFFVLFGEAQNGKSLICSILESVLGEHFATPIEPEVLCEKKGSGSSPEKMDLKDVRFLYTSELRENHKLAEDVLKKMAGGDALKTRNHQDKKMTRLQPKCTLFMLTNILPKIGAESRAVWERIEFIKFPFSYVQNPTRADERPRDPHLKKKLLEEKAGILNWLMEGYQLYLKEGLMRPSACEQVWRELFRESDYMASFVEEALEQVVCAGETTEDLYKSFRIWKDRAGLTKMNPTKDKFSKSLKAWIERSGSDVQYGVRINRKRAFSNLQIKQEFKDWF